MRRTSALIVGGGPAGAAAAIGLARGGRPPLLIERDAAPRDMLCGGFVSWATIARLERLGIDVASLGAWRVTGLGLFAGRRQVTLALPQASAGLSRGLLDAALMERAKSAGADIMRGVTVRGIDGDTASLDNGDHVIAPRMILATGKYELRGHARPRPIGGGAIGLRWRIAAGPSLLAMLEDRVELHFFRGGYAGLVRQEGDALNLCLAISPARFAETGKRPDALLAALADECPALAARLDHVAALPVAQAIANIPYGWRALTGCGGVYRVGDQAGAIPSIAGEGIDIALASGLMAAEAVLAERSPDAFQRALAARLRWPIGIADVLWRAAEQPKGALMLLGAARHVPALVQLIARATRLR